MIKHHIRKMCRKLLRTSQESNKSIVPDTLYPDDVFIVSYPRSGNTWILFILTHLILHRFDDSVDFKVVQETTPDIHMVQRYGISLDVPRPRIIKSHTCFVPEYPKVVYLVRDGRDVAVSFFHWHNKFSQFDGTFYDFIKADFCYPISWSEHVSSWLFQKHDTPLICIRYEDMLEDGPTQIRKLCDFAGISATDEEILQALKLASFDRMRKIEEERGLGYVDEKNRNYMVVREGKKGNWKTHFDERTKELFKKKHQYVLEKLGYVEDANW